MATKKKVEAPTRPDDLAFSDNKKRAVGWFRKSMDDCVWIFGKRLEVDALRELSDWARKAADYIDHVTPTKTK